MSKPHFDINAFAIKQLGEELVSDEVTALIELVKNAYDADATYANIVIDTENPYTDDETFFSEKNKNASRPGFVLIDDNGTGMTEQEIVNGWLTISFSSKRQMRKDQIVTPKKKRTPLGEKGLGRLSTQRLGSRLEMFTQKDISIIKDAEAKSLEQDLRHHVAFDWDDFSEDKTLSNVPVNVNSQKLLKQKPGTKLIISNLRDPQTWNNKLSQELFVSRLTQVISPFEEIRPFKIYLTINGKRIDLQSITSALRDMSLARFSFSYDEAKGRVSVSGRVKLSRLAPTNTEEKKDPEYQQLIEKDSGKAFFQYLVSPENKTYRVSGINYLEKAGWFISYKKDFDLASLPLLSYDKDKSIASPGSFDGEIDEFFYTGVNLDSIKDIYSKVADYRDFVQNNAGVRIYRDGFGIRPYGLNGDDWLRLAEGQTSGRSFYGMRPKNIVGYIKLSARENSQLREKTDREGFIESPHSRNFFRIMEEVTASINLLYNNMRRSYNDYKRERFSQDEERKFYDGEFTEDIEEVNKALKETETKVTNLNINLDQTLASIDVITTRAKETPLLSSEEERRLSSILSDAQERLGAAKKLVEQLNDFTKKWSKISRRAIAVDTRMKILETQLGDFSELAGLGLTAEALSHEIHNVADDLAKRTKFITSQISKKKLETSDLVSYTEYVHSAVSALRKQLSHLTPSLRYVREKKDVISIKPFFKDLSEFYKEGRFKRSKIQIALEEPFENFGIKINRGKLTQVVDNLVLNSEYWLQDSLEKGKITKPLITIISKSPFVYLFDNGVGIDPSIESSLFQPFVTMKPKGVGRGLGLFISQELLDSDGCSISLLPDKNEFGRRFKFQIDLTGALNE